MTYATPTPDDLGTYLGVADLDVDRAKMMIDQAEKLATATTNPLPDGADAVVLSAAARAFANPQGLQYETAGPFSGQRPWPGVYLTRSERRALRRLAGIGEGAFSINPTPADAMVGYVDPLAHPTASESEEYWLNNPVGY